jgi:hypothetical protein
LEFVQGELKNLCVENKIEMYTTCYLNLKKNGQAKSILYESKLLKVFWLFAEEIAIIYHNYTKRKCETKTLFKLFHY